MEENTNINVNNTESKAVDSTMETTNTEVATEVKTFTQEEMDKIIAKRISKEKQKAEQEKQEAERLATLSAEERQKAEFEKMKSEFEAERKAFAMQKMTLEVTKQLEEKELPSSLAEFIVTEDADTTKANIDNVSKILGKWLEGVLAKKAVGNVPSGTVQKETLISKEQFKNMGFIEQQEFATKYPDLFTEYLK